MPKPQGQGGVGRPPPNKDGTMSSNFMHALHRPWNDPMPHPERARAAALHFYDPKPADATIARAPGAADAGAIPTLATNNLFRPAKHGSRPLRGARA